MNNNKVICSKCRYKREYIPLKPFDDKSLGDPKILKIKTEWDKEQRDIALQEFQRFHASADFDFEPRIYPWCQKLTDREKMTITDPISGKERKTFILCARANANGDCVYFENL